MPVTLSIVSGHSWQIPDFWQICGPRLLDPETAVELGAHPRDNPEKTMWWVAIAEQSKTLLGFCSAHVLATKVELRSDFVVPRYRRCGIYRNLWSQRDQWLLAEYPAYRHEIVTRNPWQITQYKALGFEVRSKRGSFSVMWRDRQTSIL